MLLKPGLECWVHQDLDYLDDPTPFCTNICTIKRARTIGLQGNIFKGKILKTWFLWSSCYSLSINISPFLTRFYHLSVYWSNKFNFKSFLWLGDNPLNLTTSVCFNKNFDLLYIHTINKSFQTRDLKHLPPPSPKIKYKHWYIQLYQWCFF